MKPTRQTEQFVEERQVTQLTEQLAVILSFLIANVEAGSASIGRMIFRLKEELERELLKILKFTFKVGIDEQVSSM